MSKTLKRSASVILIAGGALALAASAAWAQEEDGKGWDVSASVGVNITDGNSDTLLLKGGLAGERKWDENEWRLGAEGSYGETDKETTAENAKAFGQYRRRANGLYGYIDASVLYDDIADVDYRAIAGPGVGYYLLDTETDRLSGEVGLSYVAEKVGGETDDFLAFRFAERYERVLSETAKLWQAVEYLPTAEDWDDYLLNAEVGVEAMLRANLSLRLLVQDKYDSTPAVDREKNDVEVSASLVVKL